MTTPPPQGHNPYGQPQGGAPYGQMPQQNPYGQQVPQGYSQQPGQPGFPQQPGQPAQPEFPQQQSPYAQQGAPVPPPQRNRPSLKTMKNIGLGVVVAIMATVGFIAGQDDADTAAVGDCMSVGDEGTTASRTKAGTAQYTQSGKGDDFTLCLEPNQS